MGKTLQLSIARTADGIGLQLPTYSSSHHVALNLRAAVSSALSLEPGERAYVPTGFAVGIPDGYCGLVASQRSLAKDLGLIVLDAPQIIHPADRGPLFVLIQNASTHMVVLHRGDFVAQLLIQPAIQIYWKDLSNIENVGKTTSLSEVAAGTSETANEDKKNYSKMTSSRRVYKDPRHRFSDEDKENEE